jgi:hypothetical protein
MRDRDQIILPTEVIDPLIVAFISSMIEVIGCPDEKYVDWEFVQRRTEGVAYLLTVNNAPHATLAFGNVWGKEVLATSNFHKEPTDDYQIERMEKAKHDLWTRCREAYLVGRKARIEEMDKKYD